MNVKKHIGGLYCGVPVYIACNGDFLMGDPFKKMEKSVDHGVNKATGSVVHGVDHLTSEAQSEVNTWTNQLESIAGSSSQAIQKEANILAQQYQKTGGKYVDCQAVVVTGLAAAGAAGGTLVGPENAVIGATILAAASDPAAKIACSYVFPNQ